MRGSTIVGVALSAALLAPVAAQAAEPTLEGRAVLPADTFDEGSPQSGAFITGDNGRMPPFEEDSPCRASPRF